MVTQKQKIAQYEKFLHMLQLNAEVVMNKDNVGKLISRACAWSYAHRAGNGELSEKEQQAMIDRTFEKLTEV